jgi:ribosomal protein S18 acetylase RimI-like enzyme
LTDLCERLRIRPAVPGDIDVLTILLELLFSIEADFCFDKRRHQKGLALLIENPMACLLVAEIGGEVIGMCSGQITISTAEGGPALLVEDVVVRSDRQGQHVGKRLLCALENWADDHGISRLQLLADRGNDKALGFYKKFGWQTTSLIVLRNYIRRN